MIHARNIPRNGDEISYARILVASEVKYSVCTMACSLGMRMVGGPHRRRGRQKIGGAKGGSPHRPMLPVLFLLCTPATL